jgi:hypothetical protein
MTTTTTSTHGQRKSELLGQTVVVTAGGPHDEPRGEMDFARARRFLDEHPMANTALTGATYDIDGGQQLLPKGV